MDTCRFSGTIWSPNLRGQWGRWRRGERSGDESARGGTVQRVAGQRCQNPHMSPTHIACAWCTKSGMVKKPMGSK